MARQTQIGKEIILQAALQILIEKGYQEINIKTLSKKIGCSTQPLVWHFGNMEGLRTELGKYALNYANQKLRPAANGMKAFAEVGNAYIDIAFDEPKLFQYLYMSADSGQYIDGFGFDWLITDKDNADLVNEVAAYFNISSKNAGVFCKNMIIYTHGLASFVAAGIISATKQETYMMMKVAVEGFLLQINADSHAVYGNIK